MIAVAIDGYSGSGKGTLADGLAERFNLKHLDTGSILRGVGLYFFQLGINSPTFEDIEKHIDGCEIKIEFDGKLQKTFLNSKDVSSEIRKEQIGQMASRVAIFEKAMQKVFDVTREFAKNYDCVVDGRNITSAVLPNADVKIFLDAEVECRAQRRFKELEERGQTCDYGEILASMKERDYRDTHREFSPMIVTDDSIVFDNTHISIEETINQICEIVSRKLGI